MHFAHVGTKQMRDSLDQTDVIAADAKLGYQIPRLWFPHARPGQAGSHTEDRMPASAGVSMPPPRPRPTGGADRPIGSDAVVQEYQQMQAFRAYRQGRRRRTPGENPIRCTWVCRDCRRDHSSGVPYKARRPVARWVGVPTLSTVELS